MGKKWFLIKKIEEQFDFDYTIPLDVRMTIFKQETEKLGPKIISEEKCHEEAVYLNQQKIAIKLKKFAENQRKKA